MLPAIAASCIAALAGGRVMVSGTKATVPVCFTPLQVNQALLKEDDDLLRQTFLSVFRQHHPQARCPVPAEHDFRSMLRDLNCVPCRHAAGQQGGRHFCAGPGDLAS